MQPCNNNESNHYVCGCKLEKEKNDPAPGHQIGGTCSWHSWPDIVHSKAMQHAICNLSCTVLPWALVCFDVVRMHVKMLIEFMINVHFACHWASVECSPDKLAWPRLTTDHSRKIIIISSNSKIIIMNVKIAKSLLHVATSRRAVSDKLQYTNSLANKCSM